MMRREPTTLGRMETTRLEADDDTLPTIPDDDAGEWAICELAQRAAWAVELGLDPETADLCTLPPVAPREVLPDASSAVARMSA